MSAIQSSQAPVIANERRKAHAWVFSRMKAPHDFQAADVQFLKNGIPRFSFSCRFVQPHGFPVVDSIMRLATVPIPVASRRRRSDPPARRAILSPRDAAGAGAAAWPAAEAIQRAAPAGRQGTVGPVSTVNRAGAFVQHSALELSIFCL